MLWSSGRMVARGGVPRDGHARFKQLAFVGLILHGNTHGHWFQALKPRGRLKMGALFAAMQGSTTFRTLAFPIAVGRQGRRTIKTTSGNHVLEQAWQPRACDIDRRPGPRLLRPVRYVTVPGTAVTVHVPALSVLTVVVHL